MLHCWCIVAAESNVGLCSGSAWLWMRAQIIYVAQRAHERLESPRFWPNIGQTDENCLNCRMFRTRRTGLVRRLWRSRLVTAGKEGGDGGPDDWSDSNPEKIPRTEYAPAGNNAGSCSKHVEEDGEPGILIEHDQPLNEGSEGRTVTCCLFRDLPRGKNRLACRLEHRNHNNYSSLSGRERINGAVTEQEFKKCTYAFLKKLKEKSLDVLLEAVESQGGMPSGCVVVSQTEVRIGGQLVSPKYLLCRLFRWPDLRLSSLLKPLCHCQSFRAEDSQTLCCNPHHYSRVCGPVKDGKETSECFSQGYNGFAVHLKCVFSPAEHFC